MTKSRIAPKSRAGTPQTRKKLRAKKRSPLSKPRKLPAFGTFRYAVRKEHISMLQQICEWAPDAVALTALRNLESGALDLLTPALLRHLRKRLQLANERERDEIAYIMGQDPRETWS